MFEEFKARELNIKPEDVLREVFSEVVLAEDVVDALYIDSSLKGIIGVANMCFKVPVVLELLKNSKIAEYLLELTHKGGSILVVKPRLGNEIKLFFKSGELNELDIPSNIKEYILQVLNNVEKWGGGLNHNGEHIIDLRSPSPGPHFSVNLLMGNRLGYSHALQTTPKSVVDRYGGGSFRSHAATQVLATRWDLRQEENGFPANRQFYIVENYNKIFYSLDPDDSNVECATCVHSQNHTTITYKTKCGLTIKRVIFILSQRLGEPLATEVQQIIITNNGNKKRQLKLVYTGMFGSAAPHAIFEDVLYSNIILQGRVLKNTDGSIAAVVPDYYPEHGKKDIRFHTMLLQQGETNTFPKEFCCNYNELVGNGTLTNPQGLNKLSNRLYSKGPGFFALAGELIVDSGESCTVNNFTGLVSEKTNKDFDAETFKTEIMNLISRFSKCDAVNMAFNENIEFYDNYRKSIQIKSNDKELDIYFNKNLPFQVLYQTFVSRSFCQTQKGYREIGFREIQDIYASMYYFAGIGKIKFVKELLVEWCEKIFEFGFSYHNFFWEGKEPGKWSDDALWFVQAVYRYISLSGDMSFLEEEYEIAGTLISKKRSVYDTIKAVIIYSGKISVGKHGMPLLDNADWNDCLKLDNDFIDGISKEIKYKKQLAEGGKYGEPFKSDYSESVMNAFLLKVALDEMRLLAREKRDVEYEKELVLMSTQLYGNLQKYAWKEDFFARVLFNRYKNGEYCYLGAKGDKLSSDPLLDGVYFLNSFNWAILSNTAKDEQIEIMLCRIEAVLKTPYGLKLVSPADLGKVANDTATGHYFPGDRENGAVFKHASMMAVSAMLKAAKEVRNRELASRLCNLAYWMIDLVLPYNTMKNPFELCGNPRFCTQYNNSQTGENIGPMLSGTSTWLTLSLLQAIGVEYTLKGLKIDPVLRTDQEFLSISLNTGKALYEINITKPRGFYRVLEGNILINIDSKTLEGNMVPVFNDGAKHFIDVVFLK